MKLIRIRNKRSTPTSERKFIGVYISQRLNSYLSLYSVANGMSKSVIVRDMLSEWLNTKQRFNPVEELLKDVADEVQHLWEVQRTLPDVTFTSFKRQIEDDLQNHGIDKEHVSKIFSIIGPK